VQGCQMPIFLLQNITKQGKNSQIAPKNSSKKSFFCEEKKTVEL
jgi:hypothetical protein